MEKIWDPLRRIDVALTPEERVRQWFISLLRDSAQVPLHQMMSEVELALVTGAKADANAGAGRRTSRRYRADIVVYGRGGKPLAVVECKRPDVGLSQKTLEQALRYGALLDVPFLFLTNGRATYICRRSRSESGDLSYEFLDQAPTYDQMLTANGVTD